MYGVEDFFCFFDFFSCLAGAGQGRVGFGLFGSILGVRMVIIFGIREGILYYFILFANNLFYDKGSIS